MNCQGVLALKQWTTRFNYQELYFCFTYPSVLVVLIMCRASGCCDAAEHNWSCQLCCNLFLKVVLWDNVVVCQWDVMYAQHVLSQVDTPHPVAHLLIERNVRRRTIWFQDICNHLLKTSRFSHPSNSNFYTRPRQLLLAIRPLILAKRRDCHLAMHAKKGKNVSCLDTMWLNKSIKTCICLWS